jgi:hypothetical protein
LIGFFRLAAAWTCTGDATVAPSVGPDTQTEPADVDPGFGGGSVAIGGRGATPLEGPTLSARATAGHELFCPPPVGGVGEGVVDELDVPPHPSQNEMVKAKKDNAKTSRMRNLRQLLTISPRRFSMRDARTRLRVGRSSRGVLSA